MTHISAMAGWLIAMGIGAVVLGASPPAQPEKGPGSSDYVYTKVSAEMHGEGVKAYWVFEPVGVEAGKKLPLVIFNHGWSAIQPMPYGAWIDHIVKRGNIVVYPVYQ